MTKQDISEIFTTYLNDISKKYANNTTSEYGYRTEFETLLKEIFSEIGVKRIDHDAKSVQGNKPDFVLYKEVPIVYIEVKDIGVSLDKIERSEQMSRYFGYDNLVLTDYVEFRFYRNGQRYQEPIELAKLNKKDRTLEPNPDLYEHLANTLIDFTKSHKEPIKSGLQLAKIMGGKAQRIRDNITPLLEEGSNKDDDLLKVYNTIKQLLVHDLSHSNFADMYAQTLVYGLFVARFYDESPKNFTRSEARDLIPASNPFLRHFFDHIAGPNFNKRLEHIVDELCQVFSHSDIEKLMDDYYKKEKYKDGAKGPDPIIHFYEDFLQEYDPTLRKKMGAYYTPEPVVQFIVRSIDELLKKEFGLKGGLADTTKTEKGVHKVQILDPAVGTGTFYSKVIGNIYEKFVRNKQEGRWPKYVHNDLLPRIHGFELMMAPYTIAHLKLSLAFKKTGFKYFNDRLGIYLTNSLEDIQEQGDLLAFGFAESIANESKEAAKIKKETPIMVVIGNPPYSVSSSNKGTWITKQLDVYKKDLNEKNIQPLSDDYIKFIRFAEQFVEKNGTGIVAMITNNSFIDGIIHRQMRKHLLETFDDIYILDLHGNSKKKEIAPDGSKDENVFDIMQGVSINLFVKKDDATTKLATVHHNDLYGKRSDKFAYLDGNTVSSIKWERLKYTEPYYFFVSKDFQLNDEYENGFSIDDAFIYSSNGIKTQRNDASIFFSEAEAQNLILEFKELSENELKTKYHYKDVRDWTVSGARQDIIISNPEIMKLQFRPFDYRQMIYTGKTKGIMGYPRSEMMRNFIKRSNLGLVFSRQFGGKKHFIAFCSNTPIEISSQPFAPYNIYPLYIYNDQGESKVNIKQSIIDTIQGTIGKIEPMNLFEYVYAITHSPTYRKRYKEFLKIDFPRIPYPTDRKLFDKLAKVGQELRGLHLMESDKLDNYITTYPESGSDKIETVKYKDGPSTGSGQVWINDEQYFGDVPEVAWNFYIGGYQPAQKWLKDRKGRILTNEDIEHYQRIIVALVETDKLMKKIDEIIPKWPWKYYEKRNHTS